MTIAQKTAVIVFFTLCMVIGGLIVAQRERPITKCRCYAGQEEFDLAGPCEDCVTYCHKKFGKGWVSCGPISE